MRRLAPGERLSVRPGADGKPVEIGYTRSPAERYEIRPGPDGRWAVSAVRPDVDTRVVAITGEVRDSLFASMERLGETAGLTARLVNLFEWDFDFAADSLPGDLFRLLVEKRYVGDVFLGYGDVLIAQYASVGRSTLTSVGFDDTAGRREFYDASGRSVKKMFLRAPLDFTRVTSGFSHARFHPVLGGYRPHLAVDYGAPIGTPVRAVADAVVTQAGWNGGYGISITLRHGRGWTMYNHLSKIDVRPGERVRQRQVIGQVGSTDCRPPPSRLPRPQGGGVLVNPLGESSSPARPCPPIAARRSRCTSTRSWSGSTRRPRSPRVHRDDPEAARSSLCYSCGKLNRVDAAVWLLRGAAARAVGLRPLAGRLIVASTSRARSRSRAWSPTSASILLDPGPPRGSGARSISSRRAPGR
jgi:murein DD-endopeptidase MepM/ murein hydrolase activator NlpD